VVAKTGENYPAPLAALDAVAHGLQYGVDAGLEHEAAHFSELAIGSVSRNLVRLFFAGTELKKAYLRPDGGSRARPVSNVAVVGSGFMGPSIAGLAALRAEADVRILDRDINQVVKGINGARDVLRESHRRGQIDRFKLKDLELLISGGVDWAGFGRSDLVIEAVSEDLDIKRQIVEEVETRVSRECIVASNTSTLSIEQIASSARNPSRVAGMHFFSPVRKMPLVEVVSHPATAQWVLSSLVSFGQSMSKTVIVVKDSPGFWVNRILAPYLYESLTLLEEGVDGELVDSVMKEFGFPVGPITLLDEIGLDVVLQSLQSLHERLGDRLAPKVGLQRMVDEGRLGRKTGRGLYHYRKSKKRRLDMSVYELIEAAAEPPGHEDELWRRLVYPILNEAARALDEGVVGSPRDGDLGAIFGMGFPAFIGGPFRHVDSVGAKHVVASLENLAAVHGERFAPADILVQMAEQNKNYYEQD
jgi:3-hydroxyacyl-CoA dehydrogenase/enoyl-CoA hydratase/3-hydroxybutyryl-CoA epimerase